MSIMSDPRLSMWKQRSFGKRSGDAEIKVTLLGRRDGTTCPKWVAAWLHRCRCQPDTVSGWYGWYEIRCRWRICWRSCGLWMKICRPTRLSVKATLSFEAMFLWAMSAGWQYDQLWGVAKVLQGRALIRCKHTSGELAVENHSELFLLILVYLDFFRWGCWCQNPIVLGRRAIETWFCMASVLLGAMLVSPKTMHRAEGRQSHSTRAEEASQSHNLSDGSSEDLSRTGASPAAVFDKVRSCFHRRLPWFGWPAGGRNRQNTWADSEQTWALQHVTHSEVICGLLPSLS